MVSCGTNTGPVSGMWSCKARPSPVFFFHLSGYLSGDACRQSRVVCTYHMKYSYLYPVKTYRDSCVCGTFSSGPKNSNLSRPNTAGSILRAKPPEPGMARGGRGRSAGCSAGLTLTTKWHIFVTDVDTAVIKALDC